MMSIQALQPTEAARAAPRDMTAPGAAPAAELLVSAEPMIIPPSGSRGLCICLALGLCVAGCNQAPAPSGGTTAPRPRSVSAGNGTTSWSRNPNLRPGVDEASVDMCSWDGELVFAVWVD